MLVAFMGASLGYEFMYRTFPFLVPWTVRLLHRTWIIRVLNRRFRREWIHGRKPFVGVVWHEYMLFTIHFMDERPWTILSSRSRDGEISTRIMKRFGARVVRGSSSRGGSEALRGICRNIKEGYPAVFVADGPKGPRRVSKPGPVLAASLTGAPIVPLGCAIAQAKRTRGWDRSALPIPFTTVVLGYGEPIEVPRRASADQVEEIRARVDREMERLEERCRRALA